MVDGQSAVGGRRSVDACLFCCKYVVCCFGFVVVVLMDSPAKTTD